ncbi:MAG: MFS transporter, partial [Alphaproteobacteria bacterium]|nr:MFS transporter [Alphaproteobacteria bacterium]
MAIPFWRRPGFVLVCGALIVITSFGVRQSFGLFMRPISLDLGWGREILSLALATQNLMIGVAAPFAGALAVKWGAPRTIMLGGLLFAAGILSMTQFTTPTGMLIGGGFFAGVGLSSCGLPLILSVVGQIAPEEKRSMWLGTVTASATLGQIMIVPTSQSLLSDYQWVTSLLALSAMAGMIVPFAWAMSGAAPRAARTGGEQSIRAALGEAGGHRGFWLLTVGFFVCGFQVMFISMHLPAYLVDVGASPAMGAVALMTIALFNMIGAWTFGWLGGRYRKKYLLSFLYTGRSLAILAFLNAPVSETSILLFAAAVGLLWLGTVPLT